MATVEIYDLKMEMDLNTFNSKKILSARKARLYSSVLLSWCVCNKDSSNEVIALQVGILKGKKSYTISFATSLESFHKYV